MIIRFGSSFTLVVASVALISGCSGTVEPAPAPSPFPTRPTTIALDRLEPCWLLSAEQRRGLGVRDGTPSSPVVAGRPGRGCVWAGNRSLGYAVQTIPTGADSAAADPTTTIVQVGGFGAVRGPVRDPLTAGTVTCQVIVDAAPGGSLRILAVDGGLPPPTDEQMCSLATAAAEMVLATAVTAPE